ncbi:hypothetical protein HanRHA438_Chr09g0412391 [Helianthus annuus]|uniref:Uncharacterized protein n=1 Tax=Helianthus annuus TaxID=4232 RepID=A0A9K3I869_HELAN|nr:hypothetical protein HanXRQr2_Chr09g0400581 [Helianthus annuus]KAJ0526948.1 hypothetical protein HanHA300_Chr09g0328771 [Helianthus annuus]KAJ0535521.1 hypothetical protein HanIR_Chr09g0431521 [Helianthus annuus]KAJ0543342.1 hypothetical protein HanHA89_Chr09g0349661 [Helianthus annuus]KAJ0708400.1 hypothetical protein HanLR1_Chr09g0329011 [Helianthus annuus]
MKRMYENFTSAFNFPEGILAMGGLSPFYPNRPKAFLNGRVNYSFGGYFAQFCCLGLLHCLFYYSSTCSFYVEMSLWSLMQADVKGVSFVVEGVKNQEMGVVLRGEAPNVEGQDVEVVPGDGSPLLEGASPKGSEGS